MPRLCFLFVKTIDDALWLRSTAKKQLFTTEMIARNILRKIFVSLIWSVILMITVTIW